MSEHGRMHVLITPHEKEREGDFAWINGGFDLSINGTPTKVTGIALKWTADQMVPLLTITCIPGQVEVGKWVGEIEIEEAPVKVTA